MPILNKFAELKEKVQNKLGEMSKQRQERKRIEDIIKKKKWEAYYNEKFEQAENYGKMAAKEEERLEEAKMKKKVDNKIKQMEQTPVQSNPFGNLSKPQVDMFKPTQEWRGFQNQKQN